MPKIKDTPEAWDDRTFGAQEEFVAVGASSSEDALDEALELQSIAIRLPRTMIKQYKAIASFHGVGYQPLMRDVLARFVPGALREVFEAEAAKASALAERATLGASPEPQRKAA